VNELSESSTPLMQRAALIPEISVADVMKRWNVSSSDFDQVLYCLNKAEYSELSVQQIKNCQQQIVITEANSGCGLCETGNSYLWMNERE